MIEEWALYINTTKITWFNDELQIWDMIQIVLPDAEVREETIEDFPTRHPKIILFNKPKGFVVSKDDPHNRIIYEILPERRLQEYRYIGRLDKDSTGLLLLTNDPQLVNYYESPQNNIHKVYEIQIDKPLRSKDKVKAKKGIRVSTEWEKSEEDTGQSELLKCVTVSYQKNEKGKHIVIMTLNEWKNRHIRRLFSALGYKVQKLHRIKIGKRHIDTLKPGKWKIEKAVKRIKSPHKKNSKKKKSKKPLTKKQKRARKK